MVDIIEVKTKKQMKAFATYPLKLYKDCPYYVPSLRSDEMNTLNPKKNFNLAKADCKCYLAYKDGELVGRIAAIVHNAANEIWHRKEVRFSRFDATNDLEVFEALLNAVADYGKSRGMDTIHGPWGFNDTDREGMLTYGFDKRSTYATNYFYPYFAENMRKLGWADESKWLERDFVIPKEPYEKLERISAKLKNRLNVTELADKMTVKKILSIYKEEFFYTYNESYGMLDCYVPMEGKEKENVLKQFATIINPDYLSFLVDDKGHVAAFAVVLPSIAEPLKKHKGRISLDILRAIKHPKDLEMALIGIRKEYKNSGIHAIMMSRIANNIIKNGIEHMESNPMLENNFDMQQTWKFAENTVVKKRQTFVKPL